MNSSIFGKKFILIIIGAVVIYSIFLIFSDINTVYDKLKNFDTQFLPLILLTIFSSWMVLFIRWHIILRSSNIKIPLKNNILIYLAGFTLSISPIKSGELIKSILLKNQFGIKRTISAPLVLIERFYDIIGTIAIALLGITFLGFEYIPVLFVVLILSFLVIFLIYSKSNFKYILRIFNKITFLKKFSLSLENSQTSIRTSLNKKTAICSSALTILYRFVEAIGIYLVFLSLGINLINYFELAAMYSMSVILGSVSMLPGGLGVTEGSFAGLISFYGLDFSTALVVAVIVRFFTLWYGVGIGFLALKLNGGLNLNNTN